MPTTKAKIIIAGSRSITDYGAVCLSLKEAFHKWSIAPPYPIIIFSGHAKGVDRLGELWARCNGVETRLFPADWQRYGDSAGAIRNGEMAKQADKLIAIWDGRSRGTLNMIQKMRNLEKEVHLTIHRLPLYKVPANLA